MFSRIGCGCFTALRVLSELTNAGVARSTEKRPDYPGLVVVVNVTLNHISSTATTKTHLLDN